MDLIPYTEGHRIFRQSFRKFLEKEIIPHIEAWEEEGIVPRDVWRKMGKEGFLCSGIPECYGGPGADFLHAVIIIEELAYCNFSGMGVRLHSDVVTPYILDYATEEQKRKYLPRCVSGEIITAIGMSEPNTGSDLAAIRTTAVEQGNEFVINGQKTFISNGINCDLIVLAARDPAETDPHRAIDLYLVEAWTPGFEKGRKLKKVGWHAQDTAELFFSDCRIPRENRLGEKGTGFKKMMSHLQPERLVIAIWAVAAAEFMLKETISYIKNREVFGKPVARYQHTQFEIAEMATEIKLGRTHVEKLIVDHMRGENIVTDVSMAKYWTTEMAYRTADRCMQLFGGYGYCEEYPIARAWRDIRVNRILGGTNEIMKVVIAKNLGL
ncbi:MAG TPA: acyl-CoA dehydrogenase family protein [Syntrophales bacterium]|jgi:acyl-CoA dehydrogenase|nr:acyl-CoA dehydrogenase family protein [Syntrophales bacterium]HQA83115.1 acyl-CoA dehydrogenase family protein [Syntrophales bacterium]